MSNFLAIATVTGTLRTLLGEAASVVPGAAVSTKRPDGTVGAGQAAGINIFLYQVTPNPAYRNEDLPTRRSGGDLTQRPCAALVLHYLLSFFGEERELQPQRLLGAAIRQLHARPQLAKKQIENTLVTAPFDTFLGISNLADQLDRVRFTPLSLSLDELSKIWSVFFQSPYLLSVAYQASAVLIETDDLPSSPLPVKTRNITVSTFRQPTIDEVVSAEGDDAQIFATTKLLIRGKQLRADASFVLLGQEEIKPTAMSDTQLLIDIPPGTRAGPHALQAVQKLLLGTASLHRGFESNVATFVLHPRIKRINTAPIPRTGLAGLQVELDLTIGERQRVTLLLDMTPGPQQGSLGLLPEPYADGSKVILADVSEVPAGRYFVRVQIDGAASPLDLDTASATFGPTVTLP